MFSGPDRLNLQMTPDSSGLLVMLEDDHERLARFSTVVSQNSYVLLYSRTAHDFVHSYQKLEQTPLLISLDHDLFADTEDSPDPGDGRDVAAFLATQEPVAPILIHSSNAIAADSMLFTLRDAGWKVDRIAPIGEDWIESDWFPMVRKMVRTK